MSPTRVSHRFAEVVASLLAVLLIAPPGLPADESDEAWAALVKGGHMAMIRHGNAPPGHGGDPPGMRIDDCSTQRNLDNKGRGQARTLGKEFRAHGVRVDRLAASPMCRCQETGQLMAVGSVETSWALLPDQGPSPTRFLQLGDRGGSRRNLESLDGAHPPAAGG